MNELRTCRKNSALLFPATVLLATCMVAVARPTAAQTASDPSSPSAQGTRAAQIEAARREKSQALTPPKTSMFEKVMSLAERRLMSLGQRSAGWNLRFGDLASGAGIISAGPEYIQPSLAGGLFRLRGSAVASLRKYQKYDLQLTAPAAAAIRWYALDFYAVHRNYPSVAYYGPGPDSVRQGRSNYRLEDTAFTSTLDLRIAPRLHLGPAASYLFVNVGPGTDSRYVSTEQVFSPPGIDRQANFFRYGGHLQYDYRDSTGGPRGGNYRAVYSHYEDRKLGAHDFDRAELKLEQYIPFFHEQRHFVLRAQATASYTRTGQTVPFYLQPTLGGSDDLRGYRSYRFADDNMISATAEYRWAVFSALDMAVFADAGKVFPQHTAWTLKDLESSFCFGFRFHAQHSVFLRVDTAFSHEGFQVWIKLSDIFMQEPVRPPLLHSTF
jgi:hypothetical protein